MIRILMTCLALTGLCGGAMAQEKSFVLAVPEALADSGLIAHIAPRFALKHGVRITRVPGDAAADARFGPEGRAVFEGLGQVWHYDADPGNAHAAQFGDWLRSDVGRRTVEAYGSDGQTVLFSTAIKTTVVVAELAGGGDAGKGEEISLKHCGRCHVVSDANRMKAIGSTPSFAVLRTLSDWEGRFAAFYVLKPHPAFTQVADVTPPFDPARPSPIAPVEMTVDDLDAIIAYVAGLDPADLGKPIQSQ